MKAVEKSQGCLTSKVEKWNRAWWHMPIIPGSGVGTGEILSSKPFCAIIWKRLCLTAPQTPLFFFFNQRSDEWKTEATIEEDKMNIRTNRLT